MKNASPTNTTKQSPMLTFAEISFGGGVEAQESRGQRELLNSEVLPSEGLLHVAPIIEQAGGKIGDPVAGDPLFWHVQIPAGWRKQATEHSMWSDLLDDKGRKRAGIFYKAAFYDRRANIRLERRFSIDCYSHRVKGEAKAMLVDACGEISFSTDVIKALPGELSWATQDRAEKVVFDFLQTSYPDWRNPLAYW